MVFWAIMDVIGGRIPVPALNKWLQVFPVMTALGFSSGYHRLLPRAIMRARNLDGSRDDDVVSDISETEALGAGDEQTMQRKFKKKRDMRAVKFLQDAASAASMLMWIVVTAPVMRMHFYFFKHCQTPFGIGARLPDAVPAIFDLCSVVASPVTSVLRSLAGLLDPRYAAHRARWSVLYSTWGEVWPKRQAQAAWEVTLLMIGHVWRRLRHAFLTWPWRLVTVCDQRVPMEERQRVADEFWNAEFCCMDAGFCGKLRKRLTSALDLFDETIQAFLYAAFANTVISTAWVECLFASFTQWLNRSPKALSVSNLAAKHVSSSFHRAHTWGVHGKPQKEKNLRRRITRRCRPPGIKVGPQTTTGISSTIARNSRMRVRGTDGATH